MDDFNTPADETTPSQPAPGFEDAFTDMEATLENVPTSDFITIRSGSGAPAYAPLREGETSITVREACERLGLTVGAVNVYVDQNQISFDTPVAAGTVVTLVGNVKGG